MFNPLPLRLCCLAAMAPALTSEAATRAREKLPGVPTPPHPSTQAVLNGRGCASPVLQQARPVINTKITLPNLPKDFIQKKLIDTTLSTVGKNALLGLGTVANCADLSSEILQQIPETEFSSVDESSPSPSPEKGMSQPGSVTSTSHATAVSSTNPTCTPAQNMPKTDSTLPTSTATSMPPQNVSNQLTNQTSTSTIDSAGLICGDQQQQQMPHTSMPRPTDSSLLSSSLVGLPKLDSLSNGVNSLMHKSATLSSLVGELPSTSFALPSTSKMKMEMPKGLNNRHSAHDSAPTEVIIAETVKRQSDLDTRAEKLLRRLRRLQSRQGASHVRKQLGGFVDVQQKNLNAIAKASRTTGGNGGAVDIKAELFGNRDVKNLSTAALVNLVHKLQSTQPSTLRQHLATNTQEGGEHDSKLKFDEETCMEIDRVSGHLHSSLGQLESGLDSDATESSSGGESCDELDYDEDWDGKMSRPSIRRRSEWKWAMDRAAVASRWTWLQAQVSDLEYRIRQQYDIYRQIRMSKGAVLLGDLHVSDDLTTSKSRNQRTGKKLSPLEEKIASIERKNEMSPANISTLISNVDKQSSSLTKQLGSVYTPVSGSPSTPKGSGGGAPNGVVGPGGMSNCSTAENSSMASSDLDSTEPSASKKQRTDSDAPSPPDSSCLAARCRPVKSYRKRKLLRTNGLHQLSRKAARLSTVKCQCYPPVVPCAMCGGRINNAVPLEPDVMPLPERVSLLDPSFHPVLSFKQDVPLSIHFEALLKNGEWQQRTPPKPTKVAPERERKRKNVKERVRKYKQRIPRSATAALLSSAKIKSKYSDPKTISRQPSTNSTPKAPNSTNAIRRKNRLISASSRQQRLAGSNPGTPLSRGDHNSPLSQSASSASLKDMKEAINKKRRGESAFDINNIVIPYSIASSTRVEKLQYKEIITPKWREIRNGEAKKSAEAPNELKVVSAAVNSADISAVRSADLSADKAEDQSDSLPPPPVAVKKEPQEHNGPVSGIPGVTIIKQDLDFGEVPMPTEEDLSDEIYTVRHLRCEVAEKKRFISFNTLGQRRGRANRTESGCATPEPFSPDLSHSEAQMVPSQLVTPPNTPAAPTSVPASFTTPGTSTMLTPGGGEELEGCGGKPSAEERHRSGSVSSLKREESGERRRNSSASSRSDRRRSMSHSEERQRNDTLNDADEEEVPPWLERRFPLNDYELESLHQERPKAVVTEVNEEVKGVAPPLGTHISEPPSPANSSESEVVEDDPNDPEWTVVAERTVQPQKLGGLVLKLAKR